MIDQVLSHSSDRHPWFAESRASRDNPKADWYVWADPRPDGGPPNNWLSVFGGSAWAWEAGAGSTTCTTSSPPSPTSTSTTRRCRTPCSRPCAFWLERGVDGFRLDVVNYYFHDARLRPNPPSSASGSCRGQPLRHAGPPLRQDRPENIGFLKRMRALTDRYPDRMLMGEIGEASTASG
jgi:alpha-glucosidase